MKITCERCQAEGRLGVIEEESAGLPAADIGGLCLEHAFIVLEEMRLAMHLEMCASRDRMDDHDMVDDHMPVVAGSRLVPDLDPIE